MSSQQPPEVFQESKEKGYEVRDANVPRVLIYGFGMLALVVMMGFVFSVILYKVLIWNSNGSPPPPQFQALQNELPPAPRLEEHPWLDLREFREAETRQLESYGWVDRTRGVVKIPIERAMDLIAQRGLPPKASGEKPIVPFKGPGKK